MYKVGIAATCGNFHSWVTGFVMQCITGNINVRKSSYTHKCFMWWIYLTANERPEDFEISQLGASLYGSLKLGPTPLIETFDVLTDWLSHEKNSLGINWYKLGLSCTKLMSSRLSSFNLAWDSIILSPRKQGCTICHAEFVCLLVYNLIVDKSIISNI